MKRIGFAVAVVVVVEFDPLFSNLPLNLKSISTNITKASINEQLVILASLEFLMKNVPMSSGARGIAQ
jgi:hypothetical protein